MAMFIIDLFKTVGVTGLIDMALMSVLIYALIIWFKKSKAVFVLIGFFILGLVYLAARELHLQLMAVVLQGFFAVILVAIIVIFQEEIKHMFERLALWSLNRGNTRQQVLQLARKEVEILLRTVTDLANDKVGALIILKGKDTILRHVNAGWDLNGEMSEPVLKSLFDKHSAGHDGAVIVDGGQIQQFGCHLPLSKDLKKIPKGGGTRHAAGLGLSELTDALCLIVSEERGTISIARFGELEVVSDPEKLSIILERFYEETSPHQVNEEQNIVVRHWPEKVAAITITITLWFFFVYEARLTYKALRVPVEVTNLASDMELINIEPTHVEVTLSGPHRNFYFINEDRVRVVLNMVGQKDGFRSRTIQKSNIVLPEKLQLEGVSPTKVTVATRLKAEVAPVPALP